MNCDLLDVIVYGIVGWCVVGGTDEVEFVEIVWVWIYRILRRVQFFHIGNKLAFPAFCVTVFDFGQFAIGVFVRSDDV